MEQDELIQKWVHTGLLRGVKPHLMKHVAERLERAAQKSIGTGSFSSLDEEIRSLAREGAFTDHHVNSKRHRH